MYLANRDALPLNLNPQLTWRNDENPIKQAQAARAADIIHIATKFHLTLEAGVLEPDVFHTKPSLSQQPFLQALVGMAPEKYASFGMYAMKAYPLDMSQYKRLFASTRLPKLGMDELYSADKQTARHVVVQAGPRFYRLEVIRQDGTVASADDIEAAIQGILRDAKTSFPSGVQSSDAYSKEAPVGALTGLPRDAWAVARQALESSPINAASLKDIDDALFVLTLDSDKPETHEDISKAMLHGDLRNRWFDKCFNIIVCENGRAGINWEHAWGDGAAILYFFNTIFKELGRLSPRKVPNAIPVGEQVGSSPVTRLAWDLKATPTALAAIRDAEKYSDCVINDTRMQVYQTPALNNGDIKTSGLSPDGVMQMALQMAHWRAHGETPNTYESASTAAFKHGRTETIRTATPESVALCKIFAGEDGKGTNAVSDPQARFEALKKATERHRKTTLAAVMGKGVDRHLFALQEWAKRLNLGDNGASGALPSLFTDPAYLRFKDIRLSTSTLASPALDGGGFGPVSRTSYGVAYGTEERGCHFHVMSYTNTSEFPTNTDNAALAEGIEQALQDIQNTIIAVKGKPKTFVVRKAW